MRPLRVRAALSFAAAILFIALAFIQSHYQSVSLVMALMCMVLGLRLQRGSRPGP